MVLGHRDPDLPDHAVGDPDDLAFGANIICALFINYAMRKFVIFKG